MNWEAVAIIVGALIAVGGGLLGVLMGHGSKLATIIQQLINLEIRSDENRQDHGRFWLKIDNHEIRLTRLEARRSSDSEELDQ